MIALGAATVATRLFAKLIANAYRVTIFRSKLRGQTGGKKQASLADVGGKRNEERNTQKQRRRTSTDVGGNHPEWLRNQQVRSSNLRASFLFQALSKAVRVEIVRDLSEIFLMASFQTPASG